MKARLDLNLAQTPLKTPRRANAQQAQERMPHLVSPERDAAQPLALSHSKETPERTLSGRCCEAPDLEEPKGPAVLPAPWPPTPNAPPGPRSKAAAGAGRAGGREAPAPRSRSEPPPRARPLRGHPEPEGDAWRAHGAPRLSDLPPRAEPGISGRQTPAWVWTPQPAPLAAGPRPQARLRTGEATPRDPNHSRPGRRTDSPGAPGSLRRPCSGRVRGAPTPGAPASPVDRLRGWTPAPRARPASS
ncbi:basic proline-rich protein-like [Neovison vison]|uniref:basic proline-rich protein-like n=1 Tax=Neovison vison TaxID=452646 RepID=UPI001CF03FBF|nr:basic proline-rich protein-like [Neogale vison]